MSATISALTPPLYKTLQWASPILIDQTVYQIFVKFTSLKTSWLVSSIAGGVVIWKICPKPHRIVVGGLYLAYKIAHFIYSSTSKTSTAKASVTAKPQLELLLDPHESYRQHQSLLAEFTIDYPTTDLELLNPSLKDADLYTALSAIPEVLAKIEEKKQLWSSSTIQDRLEKLIQAAADDLERIFQSIENQAGKGNFRAMANFINTTPTVAGWLNGERASLNHFYFLARHRQVDVVLRNGTQERTLTLYNLSTKNDPFLTPETPEHRWKERYNQLMKRFEPIVEQFSEDSPIRKFMIQDTTIYKAPS